MSDKPVFRVGAAGLDPRDWRLIEIVFRHSQYNRFEFRLAPNISAESVDLLIANPTDPAGLEAMSRLRLAPRAIPVIAAVAPGATGTARHAISLDRLTLQLLPMLNRVVELELLTAPGGRAAGTIDATTTPGSAATPEGAAPRAFAATADAAFAKPPAATARDDASAAAPANPVPSPTADHERVARAAATPATAPSGQPMPFLKRADSSAAGAVPRSAVASALLADSPAPDEPASVAPRVLVVDDSPTVRRQLAVAFERLGLDCEQADSAAEALRRLEASPFDLLLADVVMPDMDGYRLIREIRRDRRLKRLPVILLTSRSSPFDLARGALAGCDSYLTKPVPFRALEAAVRKQLRRTLAIEDSSGPIRVVAGAARPASRPNLPLARMARLFGR